MYRKNSIEYFQCNLSSVLPKNNQTVKAYLDLVFDNTELERKSVINVLHVIAV